MIKVENIIFHDTLVAPMIEGTRNALESWDSSDSEFNEDGLADFDGDTVLVIPTNKKTHITSTDELEGLKGYDAKKEYGTTKAT